jgi:hypothetical protein
MFFDMWDFDTHVLSTDKDDDDYFDIHKAIGSGEYSLYRFYDWGTKDNFVCLFALYKEERYPHLIIFDEIVEKGLSSVMQARLVNKYTMAHYGLSPEYFAEEIADPSMFHKRSEKNGELYSQAQFYADEGIYLEPGNNNRKVGAAVIYEHMTVKEGRPTIQFLDTCQYMINTMPTLPSKETDPEDVDTDAEDHGYDALRYGGMKLLADPIGDIPPEKMGWRDRLKYGHTHKDEVRTKKVWLAL